MKKLLFIVIFSILLFATFIISHEMTHYQIAEYYNCEETTYGVSWKGPYTSIHMGTCDSPEDMMMIQSMNDVIGYNVCPLLLFICVFTFARFLPGEEDD